MVNVFDLCKEIRRELTPEAYTELLIRLAGEETR
jgi:hypothetical protein